MTVKHRLAEIVKPAVDLIYPPRCPICGDAIAEQKGVCAPCWADFVIPGEPACFSCQRPLSSESVGNRAQCAPCLQFLPLHDGIAAGTLYNDASRKLILAYKHGRRIALAPMLARLMVARLPKLEGNWIVVPVPLHRSRLWYRGFNQAALLAEHVSKNIGQELVVDGLHRKKRTQPLGGLGQKARERTLAGSIQIHSRRLQKLEGARVILVDDVLTSGATTNACVKVLKKAGAAEVLINCFARVSQESMPSG